MEPVFTLGNVITIGTVIAGFFAQHVLLVKDIVRLEEKSVSTNERLSEVKKDIDTLFHLQREIEKTQIGKES